MNSLKGGHKALPYVFARSPDWSRRGNLGGLGREIATAYCIEVPISLPGLTEVATSSYDVATGGRGKYV